ncbi:MAG: L-histidine N(alpha)-methyltransferase [Bacteroidetes bacterium]|nr:L-histidine N(alpha)-methyltransferase [Bacteroidota bacterium]
MNQQGFLSEFSADTLKGLSAKPKYLLSKYFYNDIGSRIFQDIMQMPEYYLTDCELEVFTSQHNEILSAFKADNKAFELIELGAGDGLKTKVLLSSLVNQKIDFKYIPIDISKKAVTGLVRDLKNQIPDLPVEGIVGDYFKLIKKLNGQYRKIILFLGSNIGNFEWNESIRFLQHLRSVINIDDMVFIGFDLKKDPELILNAYNDPSGHTAAFNLNLLKRINDELGGHFDLLNFVHQEVYDEQTGTARSYLISRKKQSVSIEKLEKVFEFEAGEKILMEMSQKYDLELIHELAEKSGFQIVRNFMDSRQYFMNSLWKLKR